MIGKFKPTFEPNTEVHMVNLGSTTKLSRWKRIKLKLKLYLMKKLA